MFTIRPYKKEDLEECTQCYIESFYNSLLSKNDYKYLKDYTQCSIELSNFTFVAEFEGEIAGFICGIYKDSFDKKLAKKHEIQPDSWVYVRLMMKSLFSDYLLSTGFNQEMKQMSLRANDRSKLTKLDKCDCELALLCSKRDYRKGIGTALTKAFINKCRENDVKNIHVFTSTEVSYQFYERFGMKCIESVLFSDNKEGKSLVYEYLIND